MDIITFNQQLLEGNIDRPGLFPHLESLKASPYIFHVNFGLAELPVEPGILIIRGLTTMNTIKLILQKYR